MRTTISVKGAKQHNLKDIDIEIPRDKLTVITGVSGSGKSSLAFDTIFSEGQRKLLDSMPSFSKKFISLLPKPDVTSIIGLSPVVAIGQTRNMHNPRSTVGTMTEVSTYLRLLYAAIGESHCPICEENIETKAIYQLIDQIASLPEDTEIMIFTPVSKFYGEDYNYLWQQIRMRGYRKIKIDGEWEDISEDLSGIKYKG